jgi:hypothetical protein
VVATASDSCRCQKTGSCPLKVEIVFYQVSHTLSILFVCSSMLIVVQENKKNRSVGPNATELLAFWQGEVIQKLNLAILL